MSNFFFVLLLCLSADLVTALISKRLDLRRPRPPPLKVPWDYNKDLFPSNGNSKGPLEVMVDFSAEEVATVDDKSHSITLKLAISLQWNDERVLVGAIDSNRSRHDDDSRWIELDPELKGSLWIPELHSSTLQDFQPLSTTNRELEKLYLSPDPEFRFYYQIFSLVTFGCTMDFSEFPFDSHVCYFKTHLDLPDDEARLFQPGLDDVIGGDGGKEEEEEERNRREDSVSSPEFTFHFMHLPEEHTSEMARKEFHEEGEEANRSSRNRSLAGFELRFRRRSGSYLGQYYIPSGLIVAASWTSFVIPPDSVPARITLLVTTFLVLINVANAAFTTSPVASRVNPIQIWILGCLVFVLSTVAEYATILCYQRYVIRKTMVTRREIARQGICLRPMKSDVVGITENSMLILLAQVDLGCLVATVALFLVFNLVYWSML